MVAAGKEGGDETTVMNARSGGCMSKTFVKPFSVLVPHEDVVVSWFQVLALAALLPQTSSRVDNRA